MTSRTKRPRKNIIFFDLLQWLDLEGLSVQVRKGIPLRLIRVNQLRRRRCAERLPQETELLQRRLLADPVAVHHRDTWRDSSQHF